MRYLVYTWPSVIIIWSNKNAFRLLLNLTSAFLFSFYEVYYMGFVKYHKCNSLLIHFFYVLILSMWDLICDFKMAALCIFAHHLESQILDWISIQTLSTMWNIILMLYLKINYINVLVWFHLRSSTHVWTSRMFSFDFFNCFDLD